jgi:type IV pilus assembly protein PilW
MKANVKQSLRRLRSFGFSIVELMVAILIGLIILAGVIQVVVTSKTTFLGQEEMSFIQENARYAMDLIGKDLQGAGYFGCAGNAASVALVARVDADSALLLGPEPIRGFEGGATTAPYPADYPSDKLWKIYQPGSTTVQDYPDSFVVRGAAGAQYSISQTTDPATSNTVFNTTAAHSFKAGEYIALVAEDCRRVGVVRAATAVEGSTTFSLAAGTSVCPGPIKPALDRGLICTQECSCTGEGMNQLYLPGSVAMPYLSHAYYIADSTALPGVPALKRMVLRDGSGKEEELALGVEDMDLLYGILDSGNLRYVKASAVGDWNKVVAVQVSLLMRSQAPSSVDTGSREHLENDYNDRFMRQVVTSTFRLRNRI